MTLISRFFREPLVHFLLIGAAVFALYMALDTDRGQEVRDRIVVTEGRVQQLAQVFAKTWQRPPYPRELRGLIDAYIKEEVYYREAVKLGLDRNDTLIRRRMQQKMEFLAEPGDEDMAADDKTLQTFLDANRASYRIEPQIAFEQIFFKRKPSTDDPMRRANDALEALKSGGKPAQAGDPTLLPSSKPLSSSQEIERDFGGAFAKAVTKLPSNVWAGPLKSPFGLHVVRVTGRKDGYDPELAEIRDVVLRDWRTLQRKNHEKQAYDELLAKYEIVRSVFESDRAQMEPHP